MSEIPIIVAVEPEKRQSCFLRGEPARDYLDGWETDVAEIEQILTTFGPVTVKMAEPQGVYNPEWCSEHVYEPVALAWPLGRPVHGPVVAIIDGELPEESVEAVREFAEAVRYFRLLIRVEDHTFFEEVGRPGVYFTLHPGGFQRVDRPEVLQ